MQNEKALAFSTAPQELFKLTRSCTTVSSLRGEKVHLSISVPLKICFSYKSSKAFNRFTFKLLGAVLCIECNCRLKKMLCPHFTGVPTGKMVSLNKMHCRCTLLTFPQSVLQTSAKFILPTSFEAA